MDGHDWQRDPDGWEEGLRCTLCGITEAEAKASSAPLRCARSDR